MLDIRKRALVQVNYADDFVVSDRLISLMLAQISENKALGGVFAELLSTKGSEIYLKPAADYVQPGRPVNFYTVLEAARRRGEVAFGYRHQAHAGNPAKAYGVVINPDKSVAVTFAESDKIIVLAEDAADKNASS
ncbi:MAG: potassium transporter TrkA, partial [Dehalococcoidia bacterium]|nr:potassium transporter TrkA [Dehalococcoidia bacterium]